MFRRLISAVDSSPFITSGQLQLVRWRRKPRWLPVAKSKLFRVPERKAEDPIERAELMRLHANYKTQLRAVRSFLINNSQREVSSQADHLIVSPEELEEDFKQCSLVNDQWNQEIAEIRNKRLAAEREAQIELVAQRLEAKSERIALKKDTAERLVRIEKERAKTLITPENIDKAIEAALAETKDYNFAIDLSGNVYRNEEAPAPK